MQEYEFFYQVLIKIIPQLDPHSYYAFQSGAAASYALVGIEAHFPFASETVLPKKKLCVSLCLCEYLCLCVDRSAAAWHLGLLDFFGKLPIFLMEHIYPSPQIPAISLC